MTLFRILTGKKTWTQNSRLQRILYRFTYSEDQCKGWLQLYLFRSAQHRWDWARGFCFLRSWALNPDRYAIPIRHRGFWSSFRLFESPRYSRCLAYSSRFLQKTWKAHHCCFRVSRCTIHFLLLTTVSDSNPNLVDWDLNFFWLNPHQFACSGLLGPPIRIRIRDRIRRFWQRTE